MALASRLLGSTYDTTDGTAAKTTGAFTPIAGERVYVFSSTSNTSDVSGFTYSVSGGQILGTTGVSWPLALSVANTGGVRFHQIHEAHYTATTRSMTLSVTPSASVTGMAVAAIGVTGYPKIRQSKTTFRAAGASTAPSITFDNAVAAGSAVIACLRISANVPGTGITAPSGFTSHVDNSYGTPAMAMQVCADDSGFSGSTITWGTATTSDWAIMAIELEDAAISEMSHYIQYGADATHQVLRIQYPSADPNNITADGTSYPYVLSCPSNQWGSSTDGHPANNVLTGARALGAATVFISYREQPASVYDTQIQDLHDGIQWMIANASTYLLDTTRVGGFGISAGAHLMATAALTGGESDVGGATTPVGHIRHVLWHFGHNRPRLVDPAYTALGIARGITNCCDGSGTSVEAVMLGAVPCSLTSFDWVAADGGSLSTAKTAVYNKFCPGFWAGQWASGTKPSFELWHGDADDSIPYFCTHNPKTLGTGHALDNGFHEDLVANGFVSSYTILAGEGHGGNAFQPSLNGSATNGAAVDASIVRLLEGMGTGGDSQQDRRRRGFSLLMHNHQLPNRRSV